MFCVCILHTLTFLLITLEKKVNLFFLFIYTFTAFELSNFSVSFSSISQILLFHDSQKKVWLFVYLFAYLKFFICFYYFTHRLYDHECISWLFFFSSPSPFLMYSNKSIKDFRSSRERKKILFIQKVSTIIWILNRNGTRRRKFISNKFSNGFRNLEMCWGILHIHEDLYLLFIPPERIILWPFDTANKRMLKAFNLHDFMSIRHASVRSRA